jgi:hypothetical protein
MSLVLFNKANNFVLDLVYPFTVYHILVGLGWNQSPCFGPHESNILIILSGSCTLGIVDRRLRPNNLDTIGSSSSKMARELYTLY